MLRLFVGFRLRRVWVETLIVAWLECLGQSLHFFLGSIRACFGLRLLQCFVLSRFLSAHPAKEMITSNAMKRVIFIIKVQTENSAVRFLFYGRKRSSFT